MLECNIDFMRVLALMFIAFFIFVFVLAATTQNNHFEIVPDILMLNWTNNYSSDVYLYFNKTGLTVEALNSTPLQPFYAQQNTMTKCQYNSQGYTLVVLDKNASSYNNTFSYPFSSNVTIALIDQDHLDCRPGRYYTAGLVFRDKDNSTENISLTIFIDIPINEMNSQLSSGMASLDGSMQQGYHSFYFNSSLMENATGVLINITPQPFGIFLFDGGKLVAKSLGELITKIDKGKVYEIRVSGNQTYSGNLFFTGLNASVSQIDFGTLNVTQTNSTVFRLENAFEIEEQQIRESIVLYHLEEFSSSSPSNFTFLVPENVSALKLVMNWSGNAVYAMNLYYNNVLQKTSQSMQNIFKNASISPEEYIYLQTPTPGLWTLEVKNLSLPVPYSLRVYQFLPSFLSTNFSSISLAKGEGVDINATLSIPLTVWDGVYGGYISYKSNRGGAAILPLSFNITTPVLLVNNSLSFGLIQIKENYGKNASYEFFLPINNTGSYPVNISFASSGVLKYLNNTINITTPSSILLGPKSHSLASINFTFNSSAPKGIYVGWIMLNTTGEEPERSHPKNAYNISIHLILTDELRVDFLEIKTSSGDQAIRNVSREENVTARFKVFYINGTEIEAGNSLNTSNFQVWLEHANISYRVPASGSLSLFNATNPIYLGGDYEINFTVPANVLGGKYKVYLKTDWQKDQANYSGSSYNSTLLINNTALKMETPNSTSITLEPSKSTTFVVEVRNYGERTAKSYTLRLNESCEGYSIVASSFSGCSASKSGDTFTISSIDAYSSCQFVWTIQAGSSNASSCKSYLIAFPPEGWYDPAGFNLTVTVRASQPPTTTTTPQEEIPPEEEEIKYFSVEAETKISVEQGKNNTLNVKVKNLYTTRQTIKLSLSSINSSWFIISPTENAIAKGDYYIFRIIFNIPNDAAVGEYRGKMRVESIHHSEEVPITLTVLPGDELKKLINATVNAYEVKLNELMTKFNNTQNETIKAKLEEIKTKVNELKSYLARNDYYSAYSKLYDVKKLFDEFQFSEEPKTERVKAKFNWPLMLIGSSGLLFASALGYTAFEAIKKKGFSLKMGKQKTAYVDTKKELGEIKKSLRIKQLEEELKEVKEKEKQLEEELKKIEEKS
jgi:hypothetical protein